MFNIITLKQMNGEVDISNVWTRNENITNYFKSGFLTVLSFIVLERLDTSAYLYDEEERENKNRIRPKINED